MKINVINTIAIIIVKCPGKNENTRLENSTYNILMASGKESEFLYSTIDTYIQDAERGGREYLVELGLNEKR